MSESLNHQYSKKEELLNVISHGLGLALSSVAFPFLIYKSLEFKGFWLPLSFIIYGVSMIVLYAASTFYHAAKDPKKRRKLNIFDHAAIYVLIAGSYSPFCLVGLNSDLGWYMFVFVWLFALVGVILKLFFTGRFDKISLYLYLIMGWLIVVKIKTLISLISAQGLVLIVCSGLLYTIGTYFYSSKKIKFSHSIWHLFVLGGSITHYFFVLFFVI